MKMGDDSGNRLLAGEKLESVKGTQLENVWAEKTFPIQKWPIP